MILSVLNLNCHNGRRATIDQRLNDWRALHPFNGVFALPISIILGARHRTDIYHFRRLGQWALGSAKRLRSSIINLDSNPYTEMVTQKFVFSHGRRLDVCQLSGSTISLVGRRRPGFVHAHLRLIERAVVHVAPYKGEIAATTTDRTVRIIPAGNRFFLAPSCRSAWCTASASRVVDPTSP
jgi:hypothetical protein